MGIYDRDYARPSSNRGFGGGMQRPQKLSVNAWLIISCIAVFVLDPFISYTFQEWLHLSTDHAIYGIQYWRVIGFQFLHDPEYQKLNEKIVKLTSEGSTHDDIWREINDH